MHGDTAHSPWCQGGRGCREAVLGEPLGRVGTGSLARHSGGSSSRRVALVPGVLPAHASVLSSWEARFWGQCRVLVSFMKEAAEGPFARARRKKRTKASEK